MIEICSSERLQLALAGTIGADDEATLHAHLEQCESCSAEMELLAGGDAWRTETAILLRDEDLSDVPPPREDGTANEFSVADFTVEHLEPSDDPQVLGRLGGYDVIEVIGRGGMGVVMKAFDPELKRFVAIKALAPYLAHGSLARKRFAREAQAAAAVVHPHVMAIHQVQPGGRLPFLVMPLVAGETLAQRMSERGMLELKETLRIGMQVAAGLAAAHEQGLVHRDVKPANIMLERGVERAVITDFGLARAADDVSMTRWGIIAGTPQYMSPEQARGELLDGRSDLFSLGCLLFEMASGVSPFRAESTMATLRRLVDDRPQSLISLNSELPQWFVGIVDRLLEKEPANRFGSAKEVSELLEGCLAHLQQPTTESLPRAASAMVEKSARTMAHGPLAARQLVKRLVLVGLMLFIGGGVLWEVLAGSKKTDEQKAAEARTTSADNVRRLTKAMLDYLDQHDHYPAAVIAGKDGKGGPPHSWRVEILPQLGEQLLYDDYRFDEPWDSKHNRKLLKRMPAVFRSPLDDPRSTQTSYFGVTLALPAEKESTEPTELRFHNTLFSFPSGARHADIPDGIANTIALVEARRAMEWTRPEDLMFDTLTPAAAAETAPGGWFPEGFHLGFADGNVIFAAKENSPTVLRILFTVADGVGSQAKLIVVNPSGGKNTAFEPGTRRTYTSEWNSSPTIWRDSTNRPMTLVDPVVINAFQSQRPVDLGWREKFGERYEVKLVGKANGSVWGTDVYTDDSDIAAAAVHAGLVKVGETATITVTIVKSPTKHVGSERNGIRSDYWHSYPSSFVVSRSTIRAEKPKPTAKRLGQPIAPMETGGPGVQNPYSRNPRTRLELWSNHSAPVDMGWRERFGEQFTVNIVGTTNGSVWGTDIYTDDSTVSTAAVHAGLVQAGERATVNITVVKSPQKHTGSSRNGVTSRDWNSYPSSFSLTRVEFDEGASAVPTTGDSLSSGGGAPPKTSNGRPPTSIDPRRSGWRARFGERMTILVEGSTVGPVWGTDVYTDDSNIATAAVHAGLIKVGEQASITVTIVRSPNRHVGSLRNGIESSDYSSFPSSFVMERSDGKPALSSTSEKISTAPATSTAYPELNNTEEESLARKSDILARTPIFSSRPDLGLTRTAVAWSHRLGEQFMMKVTGQAVGSVWGTDVYTTDSIIETAAVHAGLVKVGETACVIVTIVKSPDNFSGSARNGITTMDYGMYPAAYTLSAAPSEALPDRVRRLESRVEEARELLKQLDASLFKSIEADKNLNIEDQFIALATRTLGNDHSTTQRLREEFFWNVILKFRSHLYNRRAPILEGAERWERLLELTKFDRRGESTDSLPLVDGRATKTATPWGHRFGEQFDVVLHGNSSGSVYGTNIYTDNSSIASAAVHAGLVQVGEIARLTVTIVKPPKVFLGTNRNGIRSFEHGAYHTGFTLRRSPRTVQSIWADPLKDLSAENRQYLAAETRKLRAQLPVEANECLATIDELLNVLESPSIQPADTLRKNSDSSDANVPALGRDEGAGSPGLQETTTAPGLPEPSVQK